MWRQWRDRAALRKRALCRVAPAGPALSVGEMSTADAPLCTALAAAQDELALRAVLLQRSPPIEGIAGLDDDELAARFGIRHAAADPLADSQALGGAPVAA